MRPEWGHKIFDPDGRPIQVPAKTIMTLRRLGLLIRNRDIGGLQILPSVRDFLTPEYDAITEGLRRVLGTNIEGPQQLVCNCQSCRRIRNEALQGLREQLHDFKADMRRQ